jgi:hypothetical protein
VSGATKAIAMLLLKALVTAACLMWLARYFDFEQVRAALAGVDVSILIFEIL